MSTKLTNLMREGIANRVLTHRFSDQVKALETARAAFAVEVYNDIYRKADRETMQALPKGWLAEIDGIYVQFGDGGRYERLDFDGRVGRPLSKVCEPNAKAADRIVLRVQERHRGGCSKVYEATHRLAIRQADLKTRCADLETAYDTARRQVEAALSSATTINKLVEMWPEVEPFARHLDKAPLAVPAIQTSELNALLDLPVAA